MNVAGHVVGCRLNGRWIVTVGSYELIEDAADLVVTWTSINLREQGLVGGIVITHLISK